MSDFSLASRQAKMMRSLYPSLSWQRLTVWKLL